MNRAEYNAEALREKGEQWYCDHCGCPVADGIAYCEEHSLEVSSGDPGVFNTEHDTVATALETLAQAVRIGSLVGVSFDWHEGKDPTTKISPRQALDFIRLNLIEEKT